MQTTTMPTDPGALVAETSVSAVSWGAIIAGAFVMAAVTILLVALGSGLSLSSVSPWPGSGVSVTGFTVITAIWLIVVQWLSAALGGYLTGRLRTHWAGVHVHEVFFRDTAHGLLAWAVASVIGIGLLTSAVSSIVGGSVHAATSLAAGAASGASQGAAQSAAPGGYYIDQLFRSDSQASSGQDPRPEATRILAMGIRNGSVPDGDKTYLARLVAERTGISQDDARKRVDNLIGEEQAAEQKVKAAADQSRKAVAALSFYTFFSMLIGAFIASVAAALGGRSRDVY
ncbi:hypothetical protein [Acidisphaera sp. S103]|uniref:hypothetical protein n=1 Tax=Acidisphaera sp. S103 TaxID=1747223 RepID=UPI00131E5728|nr:hypothetical protein [Acidisphaera sp. S103]